MSPNLREYYEQAYTNKLDNLEVMAFLVSQLVKNPPATQKTPAQSLGQEDLLEKG